MSLSRSPGVPMRGFNDAQIFRAGGSAVAHSWVDDSDVISGRSSK